MKTHRLFTVAVLWSLIWTGFVALQVGRAQTYVATDLGTPSGSATAASEGHGVNRLGSVAEAWWPGGFPQDAALYRNGTNTNLGALNNGHDYAIAYAVNDANKVVGLSSLDNNFKIMHAFFVTNGGLVDLGALGDGSWSSANAINNAGLIAGETITANGTIQAALFQNGTITNLGTLTNGNYSTALGINDSNLLVGNANVIITPGVQTNNFGFIYSNGVMSQLGTLGSGTYSSAAAINNSGQIVGESAIASGGTHAYLLSSNAMMDLGTIGGGTYSTATAINNAGQVAGYATDANGIAHAFVYTGSAVVNLDNVLPPNGVFTNLTLAYGINDAGQISGAGFTTNGSYHAFLVTPPVLSLTCSTNITITASSSTGAIVSFSLTVTGGCSQATLTANPPSGSNFPVGTNTVNVTASDLCGHTNTCSFTVKVNPPVYPPIVLACPTNITVTATSSNGAVVSFAAAASGGCSSPNVVASPPSGSTFPVGTTTVTTTAGDSCGTSTNCSFIVTVNPPLTPMTVTVPTVLTNNQFKVTIQGAPGQRFAIQASTNLVNWTALNTNTLVSTTTNWMDAGGLTNNFRFYRALTLP